jgi:hypothetical protein
MLVFELFRWSFGFLILLRVENKQRSRVGIVHIFRTIINIGRHNIIIFWGFIRDEVGLHTFVRVCIWYLFLYPIGQQGYFRFSLTFESGLYRLISPGQNLDECGNIPAAHSAEVPTLLVKSS